MDAEAVFESVQQLLSEGNYSVLVLILAAMLVGRWRLQKFDDKNSYEHKMTSERIDNTTASLHEKIDSTSNSLGRSIDRIENAVIVSREHLIRTEEKLDTHLNDHIVSLAPSRQKGTE